MAKKTNTLTQHVRNVHRSLALANFVAYGSHSAMDRDTKRIQAAIDAGHAASLITLAALNGSDIYAAEPALVNYGHSLVTADDVLLLVSEGNGHCQALAVAEAYEAMEVFIKNITGPFWYVRRGKIPVMQKKRKLAKKRFGKRTAQKNTPLYFDQIVHILAWHNTEPVLDVLFTHVDGLHERLASTHFGNLHDAHRAVAYIRHTHTHAGGRHNADSFAKLPQDVQRRVHPLLRKSVIHSDLRILPTYKEANALLAREAEYAQIIYDTLTNAVGMNPDYQPK